MHIRLTQLGPPRKIAEEPSHASSAACHHPPNFRAFTAIRKFESSAHHNLFVLLCTLVEIFDMAKAPMKTVIISARYLEQFALEDFLLQVFGFGRVEVRVGVAFHP